MDLRRETGEEKERRKREREERRKEAETADEQRKRLRAQEIAEAQAAFEAELAEEESKQQALQVLEPDGSEKPATLPSWERKVSVAEGGTDNVAADEAWSDKLDARVDTTLYYQQGHYPVDALVQYATRNGRLSLHHCEFAVITKQNAFWRHLHYTDADELREWLTSMAPARVEMGPWHMEMSNVSKTKHTAYSTLPVQRYLAFDVDMANFHEDELNGYKKSYIRKCRCRTTGGTCSYGCWFYMRVAVKVCHDIFPRSLSLSLSVFLFVLPRCSLSLSLSMTSHVIPATIDDGRWDRSSPTSRATALEPRRSWPSSVDGAACTWCAWTKRLWLWTERSAGVYCSASSSTAIP